MFYVKSLLKCLVSRLAAHQSDELFRFSFPSLSKAYLSVSVGTSTHCVQAQIRCNISVKQVRQKHYFTQLAKDFHGKAHLTSYVTSHLILNLSTTTQER